MAADVGKASSPMFDLTSLNAIQSAFKSAGGNRDPWAIKLSGSITNMLVYSDTVRYPLPVAEGNITAPPPVKEPSILNELQSIDTALVQPVPYSTKYLLSLKDEHLDECFANFLAWARRNRYSLKRWCTMQLEEWIQQDQRASRVKHGVTFDLERLAKATPLSEISSRLGISREMVLYTFDLVLRLPIYGAMAGKDCFLLNHPIRDAYRVFTMLEEAGPAPDVPVSFAPSMRQMVRSLTRDEYIWTIATLREIVREYGLRNIKQGGCDPEVLREIAAKARFRPSLRGRARIAAIVSAVAAGAVASLFVGPAALVGGIAVSLGMEIWKENRALPRAVSSITWLRWGLKWDLEEETAERMRDA